MTLMTMATTMVVVSTAMTIVLCDSQPSLPPPGAEAPVVEEWIPAVPQSRNSGQERAAASAVSGRVVDPSGQPVGWIQVTNTRTAEVTESAADGSFAFRGGKRGRCRVQADAEWLAIESHLLELCQPEQMSVLVVAPRGQPQGQVIDVEGRPVTGARVAIELRVDIDGWQSSFPAARSVRIRGEWSSETNDDGWYFLPPTPVGPCAWLVVEHREFSSTAVELSGSRGYQRVTLWDVSPQVAAAGHSQSREQPVVHPIAGWLRDEQDRPRSGWWVGLVADGDKAAAAGKSRGRFVQAPVRAEDDGHFTFAGLNAGSYQLEAWQPANHGALRSNVIAVPTAGLTLCVTDAVLSAPIRGRVLDADGRPICGATVGLGRPTAWAVSVRLAMHTESQTSTDRQGKFELAPNGLSALELLIGGAPVVPMRIPLDFNRLAQTIDIRAARRSWLDMPESFTATSDLLASSLQAMDVRDHGLPMWLEDSYLARPRCGLTKGPVGFPARANALVLQSRGRELGRIRFTHEPARPFAVAAGR